MQCASCHTVKTLNITHRWGLAVYHQVTKATAIEATKGYYLSGVAGTQGCDIVICVVPSNLSTPT